MTVALQLMRGGEHGSGATKKLPVMNARPTFWRRVPDTSVEEAPALHVTVPPIVAAPVCGSNDPCALMSRVISKGGGDSWRLKNSVPPPVPPLPQQKPTMM
jgi:hypothetical protein